MSLLATFAASLSLNPQSVNTPVKMPEKLRSEHEYLWKVGTETKGELIPSRKAPKRWRLGACRVKRIADGKRSVAKLGLVVAR